MKRLMLAALFLSAFSGCIEGTPELDVPILDDAYLAWLAGAPSANIHPVGSWDNGGGQEADARGGLLAVDRGTQIAILNVMDASDIVEVSTVDFLPEVVDVKWSDDGQYLFAVEDQSGSTAANGGTGPFVGGIYVIDMADPANPELVTFQEVGPRRGPHMVTYHQQPDGTELLVGANADISIHVFDRAAGTVTEQSRYSPDIATDWNRDPEVVDVLYQGWAHDAYVTEDPLLGTVMYVANWDAGLRIVDINDPANPVELGKWMDFPAGHEGNLHTVAASWVGDRRIVVGTPEVGFAVVGGTQYARGEDRSVVYVWDATDASAPRLLGWWENPDHEPSGRDMVPGEAVSSTHNVQFVDGRVYVAHYAMGVFVLDVSTPANQAAPEMLGYFHEEGMDVWDVVVMDGTMWTSGVQGAKGLHFMGDVRGPLGIDSTA